jgi:hypothetical protein
VSRVACWGDVLPQNWTSENWTVRIDCSLQPGGRHEEEQVLGEADCDGLAAGRGRRSHSGGDPEPGVSEATYYHWRKKYGPMAVGEIRRLRQLEEENRKLKQFVADLTLDKVILQEVLAKKA